MRATESLRTWLSLMTTAELDELAASFGWTTTHLSQRIRPRVVDVLQALDTLIVAEQHRRLDQPRAFDIALAELDVALTTLERLDVQDLFRSFRRLARNREKDASEPIQRFHAAVSDLLQQELERRVMRDT